MLVIRTLPDTLPLVRRILALSAILILVSVYVAAQNQTTSFTYQGRLTDGGTPASGSYDLQFTLWDAASGGTQQPQPAPVTVTRSGVSISGGIFTAQLDFGVSSFPGADRFLEIGVRPASIGSFTILSSRQQISSTPYAIRTLSAASADTATNATQLGGMAASQYVQTNDARLTDFRSPTPGSSSYIQNNPPSTQSGSFNISGDSTAGTLNGNVINATTQYNIGGNRILSATSTSLFAGVGAGQANTGARNTFMGQSAGPANTTGGFNSFFGTSAGSANTTGASNAFLGAGAGVGNTSGNNNSFFGGDAGQSNGTGALNTLVGASADVGAGGLTNATAIGASAFVEQDNSLVLGSINGVNNATADTLVGIGTTRPHSKLEVHGINTGQTCNVVKIQFGAATGTGCGNALAVTTSDPAAKLIEGTGQFGTVFNVKGNGEINTLGALSVGTLSPVRTLTVNGRARIGSIPPEASAASVCFNSAGDLLQCGASSLRFKTNVQTFRSGLDILRRLRPISFNWKESGLPDIGLGAEEVAKVAPSFTFSNDKGEITGVKYERLNILLINAVKEQQTQIENLRAQNAGLSARLRGVEKALKTRARSARRRR